MKIDRDTHIEPALKQIRLIANLPICHDCRSSAFQNILTGTRYAVVAEVAPALDSDFLHGR